MIYLNEDEIENVWGQIYERTKQENVTVTAQTFLVTNEAEAIVQISGAASLQDNGTALVLIYGEVDTTAAGFVLDAFYDVHFYYMIGTEALHKIVRFYYGDRPLT